MQDEAILIATGAQYLLHVTDEGDELGVLHTCRTEPCDVLRRSLHVQVLLQVRFEMCSAVIETILTQNEVLEYQGEFITYVDTWPRGPRGKGWSAIADEESGNSRWIRLRTWPIRPWRPEY